MGRYKKLVSTKVSDITRNIKQYKGKRVKYIARIYDITETRDYYKILCCSDNGDGFIEGSEMRILCCKEILKGNELMEYDWIKIYGEIKGLYTYTTIENLRKTIPRINAEKIKIFGSHFTLLLKGLVKISLIFLFLSIINFSFLS
ncbi:hypothetical protein [Paraclostridium sordellii]|uniref:hypothetical protein n=1 Tax=Paraclostridium sordellii TaxID=1505 RepID=UPI0005E154DC|nr:hypothetical protein [Paeniclostridium sordellii]CEP43777.1 Uncharacterised protein [[Clostridium] sordellii] [Paeniclostridium sordellii]CEP50480.1 Uncharacterised protein [[Clostridium] sordellii] [Paeniclostridium sordellii]